METIIYIYHLKCPISNEIRYVGKSTNPKRRLSEHCNHKSNTYKSNWIQSLIKQNLKPILEIIETCNENDWTDKEKYWIAYYKEIGYDLTNGTDGGEDGRMTIEVRQKLSVINSGSNNPCFGKVWTKIERTNLSDALKDRKLSDKHKANIKASAPNKRKVLIYNKEYNSITDAGKELNIDYRIVHKRINSDKYQDYQYVK